MPREPEAGGAEQTVAFVNELGTELFEQQAALQLEVRRVQEVSEVLGQTRPLADRFLLQDLVQIQQRLAKWHFPHGEGCRAIVANVRGEHRNLMPFGAKRLYQAADVRRRPLRSEDGNAEIGRQIGNAHVAGSGNAAAAPKAADRD